MGLNNFILTCEKDNEELIKDINYYKNMTSRLKKENEELKKQLEECKKELEIIKKGTKTPPDKRVYITKCRTCGCEFTYMEEDIKKLFPDNITKVVCPQCNYWVFPFIKRKYKGDDKNGFI